MSVMSELLMRHKDARTVILQQELWEKLEKYFDEQIETLDRAKPFSNADMLSQFRRVRTQMLRGIFHFQGIKQRQTFILHQKSHEKSQKEPEKT